MSFILPPLPFERDALAPHMSAETLDFHHGKHHKAYVDKTNELLGSDGLQGSSLVDVIRDARPGPLLDNASQLWNHSFFWQCLSPGGPPPTGPLAQLIERSFGSTEALLKEFGEKAAAHFGSGWTWLVLDENTLRILTLHDGESPVSHEEIAPLFTLDVWEHAYYLDYRNARPKFIEAVLHNLVDWEFVALNLDGNGVARADQT